jgi:hypothetical protein
MTNDPLALLAAANPVPELPTVAPVENLPCLAETPHAAHARRSRRPWAIAVGATAALAVLAVAIGLTLSGGSSGPGVDVAAAAYAATSPDDGVIEAEFVIGRSLAAPAQATIRHREWLDAATGRRRVQTLARNGDVESELATSPGSVDIWESGPAAPGTILHFKAKKPAEQKVKPDGLALYRRLYKDGTVRLVGKEAFGGRMLWRLEGAIGFTKSGPHEPLRPVFGEVPTTYLPVVERQVDLTRPGHPTMLETRLTRYRRIPHGPHSDALVLLSAAHPGARVLRNHHPLRTVHVSKSDQSSYLSSRHVQRAMLEAGSR